jgi:ArsR family transcriptional regulator
MREEQFVKIAKALADPTRHRMLREIRSAGEMTCSGVCDCFALAQPTISHHIRILEESGLIRIRKDGQYHVLSVNEPVLEAFAGDLAPARPPRAKRATSKSRA